MKIEKLGGIKYYTYVKFFISLLFFLGIAITWKNNTSMENYTYLIGTLLHYSLPIFCII